ncbi:MAG: hypothetical protein V2I32_10700 [Desulforhopalus sp.]|jgi:hypothetical protein|nr:hypothetical protein [Desulforhopalus sp.]
MTAMIFSIGIRSVQKIWTDSSVSTKQNVTRAPELAMPFQMKLEAGPQRHWRRSPPVFWSIWAVVTTFVVLPQIHTCSTAEWVGFFLVVPLFWLMYKIVRNSLVAEMKPYLLTSTAIRVARCLTPPVAATVYLAVTFLFVEVPQYDSLKSAIDYGKGKPVNKQEVISPHGLRIDTWSAMCG